MAEKLCYYLLALTLAGDFFLVYGIVLTELRSRHERRERERLRAAYSEIKRLQASESAEQQKSVEIAGWDSPEALDGVTLDQIEQLQTELKQSIIELEREL
jgi:hypothetical protein